MILPAVQLMILVAAPGSDACVSSTILEIDVYITDYMCAEVVLLFDCTCQSF